jgi:Mycoplasma protein of unknown function, DUF285
MNMMFYNAEMFNRDLRHFDTSSVVSFKEMFYDAQEFNQDISMWNLGSAKFLKGMLAGFYEQKFDQDLCVWGATLSEDADVSGMLGEEGSRPFTNSSRTILLSMSANMQKCLRLYQSPLANVPHTVIRSLQNHVQLFQQCS